MFVSGAYPDLVIGGPNFYLIFEAKVMSGFQTDQVVPYAQALLGWREQNPGGLAKLIIIAPRNSLQALVLEAVGQMKNKGLGVPVGELAWEEVAKACEVLSRRVQDTRLQVYLEDFAQLVSFRIGELPRAFTPEEVQLLGDQLVGGAIWRLWPLVQDVNMGVQQKLSSFIPGFSSSAHYGGIWAGFNFFDQRKRGLGWFGVWVNAWAKVGRSPLFYQIPEDVFPHLDEINREAKCKGHPAVERFYEGGNLRAVVPLRIEAEAPGDLAARLAAVVAEYVNLVYPRLP
ncbi:MAG: hypothetical protein AB1609_20945 [Bacillota bacterium]